MTALQKLHDLGQSIWIDNISRGFLTQGILFRYITELSVTGLTSNPTIFNTAINNTNFYNDAIRQKVFEGKSGDGLFFELALEDLTHAADLFRPIYDATGGVDGWVSVEISPYFANNTEGTVKEAAKLHALGKCPNLFIKIPGTREGLPAIEEMIFRGVPINITLLFSREQYLAAANAYMSGIERRIAAGLSPKVASVASLFVSRWDKAVIGKVPKELQNRLGIASAKRTYKAYREMLYSPRWHHLAGMGAQPQRLLWASTGIKDPKASDVLYVEALAAPDTINTMPAETLLAFADHGKVGKLLVADGGDCEEIIAGFKKAGIDDTELAAQLQEEGVLSFSKSWNELMVSLSSRRDQLLLMTHRI